MIVTLSMDWIRMGMKSRKVFKNIFMRETQQQLSMLKNQSLLKSGAIDYSQCFSYGKFCFVTHSIKFDTQLLVSSNKQNNRTF